MTIFHNTRHSSQARTINICTLFNPTQVPKSIMSPTWEKDNKLSIAACSNSKPKYYRKSIHRSKKIKTQF